MSNKQAELAAQILATYSKIIGDRPLFPADIQHVIASQSPYRDVYGA